MSGQYHFKPVRNVEKIPKAEHGKSTRSLRVGNPRDKIVQKAIEVVLNYIYEEKLHKFSDRIHGLRPNRGCHTALEQIKFKWKAIP